MIPAAIASFLAIIGAFYAFIYWLPKYADIFRSLNARLPLLTALTVNIGDFLQVWWFVIIPIAFSIPVIVIRMGSADSKGPTILLWCYTALWMLASAFCWLTVKMFMWDIDKALS
jgi:type II secretory pathway component PulF